MKIINTDINALKIDKNKYKEYEDVISNSNEFVLKFISLLASVTFLIVSIVNLSAKLIDNDSIAYLICFGINSLIFLSTEVISVKNKLIRKLRIALFMFTMFGFGIVMGTIVNPNQLTVSYIVLLFSVPLLFSMRPLEMNIIILISVAVYIPMAFITQPHNIFVSNIFDVAVYGIMCLVITSYMMVIKMQRFLYMERSNALEQDEINSEKRLEKYESFITDMIRYSSEDGDAKDILNQILAYIGERFESDRAYIFEVNGEGTFDNTFEWCREGVSAEIDNLQGLPYEGLVEVWIEQYKNSNNIVIPDVEEYKKTSQAMYDILKPQGIKSLVTGPIKTNGIIVGFYGVDNPPIEKIEMISEMINLMEFVISMMVRLKDDSEELESTALHDQLTGCKNRTALTWAYTGKYDKEASFSIVMCDLNGLKEVNDRQGHDAGDRFIHRTADVLREVFGADNVYRMGGDEFLVVLVDKSKEQLDELLSLLKIQIGETACIGSAYRDTIGDEFEKVMKEADVELYKQKDIYYQTHKKYR